MFQNPGFIQTNKQANKLTNKLPRPMWIAVGSSKGNIVLGIDNNLGSRFVSGILNVSSAPGPRPRDAYLGQPPPPRGSQTQAKEAQAQAQAQAQAGGWPDPPKELP